MTARNSQLFPTYTECTRTAWTEAKEDRCWFSLLQDKQEVRHKNVLASKTQDLGLN